MNSKRIVFSTFGSLGDLHPYLAIARELLRRGHRPVVATFDNFRGPVEAAGAGFAAIRPSMDGFGDHAAMMKRLVDPWRGPELLIRGMFMPHLRETYEDLARVCRDADLLVTHPLTFAGVLLAQKEGLRWASTALSPMTQFSAIDPPVFPAAPWLQAVRRLGVTPYRWLFRIPRAMVRRWEQPLYRFRAELGLNAPGPIAQFEGQYSPQLHLALFSGLLAAPQPDWPVNTVVCGFPRYDGPDPDAATVSALESFLAAGEAPLVFGLGSSAVMVAGGFWRAAIDAARQLGRRALLLTGSPPEGLAAASPAVGIFNYLPYSLVFPHGAAIIHSGGIGTLAQALASGRPQLVVPVAFDQPDNARRATALGTARTIPFREATGSRMAQELSTLLGATGYAERATAVGHDIRAEDAAGTACDALLKLTN